MLDTLVYVAHTYAVAQAQYPHTNWFVENNSVARKCTVTPAKISFYFHVTAAVIRDCSLRVIIGLFNDAASSV
jgi:hypothetical protein